MSKRNLIKEIEEKNARASEKYLHGSGELLAIERSFSNLEESDSMMAALHLMGVASCIEVSAREAIKLLIDSGAPFLERAESFKDIKFDFELTKALSSGRITFGDLVSHSLPISRLGHIESHFEILFSEKGDAQSFHNILSNVRVYVEPDEEEVFGDAAPGLAQKTAPFMLSDVSVILKNISAIFERRHIIAHEANFDVISVPKLGEYIECAKFFTEALYELVDQILNLGVSRNAFKGSVQEAFKAGTIRLEAQGVQEEIVSIINLAAEERPELSTLFEETCKAFDLYESAESYFRLGLHGFCMGNAMRNIEANITKQLWQHRKMYLTEVKDGIEFYLKTCNS